MHSSRLAFSSVQTQQGFFEISKRHREPEGQGRTFGFAGVLGVLRSAPMFAAVGGGGAGAAIVLARRSRRAFSVHTRLIRTHCDVWCE